MVGITCTFFLASACLAQSQNNYRTTRNNSLKVFLQDYLTQRSVQPDLTTLYSIARAHLSANKRSEIIVYITGQGWCGSGGCTALILEPEGTSYRVITYLTLARLPIRILPAKTNGWQDIAMLVAGGGILHPYWAVHKFDGKQYVWTTSRASDLTGPKLPKGVVTLPLSVLGNLLYGGNSAPNNSSNQ
jgi:hypothetical protein